MQSVQPALEWIRAREPRTPEIALVLGSGLGALADSAAEARSFDTADIPGYPRSTVAGHAGRLVFGTLEGKEVLFVQGRVHLYEGHGEDAVTFPIRLAHALGARRLLLTNAAGGINLSFPEGTLMLIEDHINFSFRSPLTGPVAPGQPRFPDLSQPYSHAWMLKAEEVALEHGIPLRRGTYLWATGPSYETKAEIRAFARMGADAVGMSTVPETLQAVSLGMEVLGISTITNKAAGLGDPHLSHEDVLEVGRRMRGALETLVRGVVR